MVLGKAGRRADALACAEVSEEFLTPVETKGENESVTKFIRYKLRVARDAEGNKDKKVVPRDR
jgi:hypothetical protein